MSNNWCKVTLCYLKGHYGDFHALELSSQQPVSVCVNLYVCVIATLQIFFPFSSSFFLNATSVHQLHRIQLDQKPCSSRAVSPQSLRHKIYGKRTGCRASALTRLDWSLIPAINYVVAMFPPLLLWYLPSHARWEEDTEGVNSRVCVWKARTGEAKNVLQLISQRTRVGKMILPARSSPETLTSLLYTAQFRAIFA